MFYIILILLVVRPATVLIHELGHGLAALWVARGPVTLFFGTYGDVHKGFRIRLGRLTCHFSAGIYLQGAGLCVLQPQALSTARQCFYIVMGPLASLFVLPFFLIVAADPGSGDVLARVCAFCALSCVLDLFVNLIPSKDPIMLKDGTYTYNDGRLLLNLLSVQRFQDTYDQACAYYNAGDHARAAPLFHHIVRHRKRAPELYRLAIAAYVLAGLHQEALRLMGTMAQYVMLEPDDLVTRANAKARLGDLSGAVADLDHAARVRPDDVTTLNDRGYYLEQLGRYNEALAALDRAVELDAGYAFAYNNRGLVKVRLGRMAEARADIERSMVMDPTNAYALRNLGILHVEQGNLAEALGYLEQAEALEKGVPLVAEYMKRARPKD